MLRLDYVYFLHFVSSTVSTKKINSSFCLYAQGQYTLQREFAGIPAVRVQKNTIKESSGFLFLPATTLATFKGRFYGAQTERGIVYGVNPDLSYIICKLRYIAKGSFDNCFQISGKDSYDSSKVFFTSPAEMCMRDIRVTANFKQQESVLFCNARLTQTVSFTGIDSFIEIDQLDSIRSDGVMRNLFIDDVTYYDSLNVVVSVRRGPVEELIYESGHEERPPLQARLSRTVFYFIHTETLAVRAHRAWGVAQTRAGASFGNAVLCSRDMLLPPFGALFASFTMLILKNTEIVTNQFIFNGIGITEDIVATHAIRLVTAGGVEDVELYGTLCYGGAFGHNAFGPCGESGFSLSPSFRIFTHAHSLAITCAQQSARYVTIITGISDISGQNVVPEIAGLLGGLDREFAGPAISSLLSMGGGSIGAVLGTLLASSYGLYFVLDGILIPYLETVIGASISQVCPF